MYSVSAEFTTAMNAPVQEHKVKGTIGSATFGPGNILSGSFFVTNQCSENNALGIGQVYIGELGATFRNVGISDGAWVGQVITPAFSLKTSNGWEDVPLGVYTVAEATISASGVTVKAYDNMSKFDKAQVGVIEEQYPYDILSMACTACGVSMTTTRAQIEAMANGTMKMTMSDKVETWRDVVAWVAQAIGANATMDRSGYLRIFQFGSTSVATYDDDHRHSGATFADFETRYTGISLTISATNTTYYYADSPDDALTMELGANPFLQIGSDNDRQTACENILTDLSAVQYSPFSVNLTGCPIYDLGDVLTFSDGILSASKTGCVTYYNYTASAAYNIKGGGKNPAEAASKSRIDKVVESLSNTVAEEVNQMSVVQNSAAVSIADQAEASVLVYNFEVTEDDNLTMLDVSVVMTSSATETVSGEVYTLDDIVAKLHFYVDGSEVTVYGPEFIVDEGKDTMAFNYSLSGLSVGAHEFDIRLEMDGGSGSIAVGDVHEMLWGYGITFEVYMKSLDVVQMPTKVIYVTGQNLDLTGLAIDGVYNNGLRDDVTADCSYDPADGTALTDLGTVTIDASLDTDNGLLETSFDVLVAELVMFITEDDDFSVLGNVFEGNNMGLYVRCVQTAYSSSAIDVTLHKAQIDTSADVPALTNNQDISVSLNVVNSTNSLLYATIDELMYLVSVSYTGSTDPRNVMYDAYEVDMLNNTTKQLTIAYDFVNPPYAGMTIDGINVPTNRQMVVVDGYMLVNCEMYATYNGVKSAYYGYAYATVSGTVMTWHFVNAYTDINPTRYSNFGTSALSLGACPGMTARHSMITSEYKNGYYWLHFSKLKFDTTNLLRTTDFASINSGSSSSSIQIMLRVIGNTNQFLVRCSSKWILVDEDAETAEELASFSYNAESRSTRVGATSTLGGIIPDECDEIGTIFWWDSIEKYVYVDTYGAHMSDALDGTWEDMSVRMAPASIQSVRSNGNVYLYDDKCIGLMVNYNGHYPAALCLGAD